MPALTKPKPPATRRRLRRAVILLLLIASTITAIRLTPRTLEKSVSERPERVAELSSPARSNRNPRRLAFRPDRERSRKVRRPKPRNRGMATRCLGNTPAVAGRPLPGLDAFLTNAGQPLSARHDPFGKPLQPTPILYCGQRDCPAGKRLIRISYYAQAFTSHEFQGMIFSADIFETAGPFNPLRKPASNLCYAGRHNMQPYQALRLFAGQWDPKDLPRFTISISWASSWA